MQNVAKNLTILQMSETTAQKGRRDKGCGPKLLEISIIYKTKSKKNPGISTKPWQIKLSSLRVQGVDNADTTIHNGAIKKMNGSLGEPGFSLLEWEVTNK